MAPPSPPETALPAATPSRKRRSPATVPVAETPAPEPPPAPPPLTPDAVGREIAGWSDGGVERLHGMVAAELRRRGLLRETPEPERPAAPALRQRQPETLAAGLAPGQVNAILAASQAGVKLSRIAQEFGLPLAAVKRAIAGASML